jgi:hypothetical protein
MVKFFLSRHAVFKPLQCLLILEDIYRTLLQPHCLQDSFRKVANFCPNCSVFGRNTALNPYFLLWVRTGWTRVPGGGNSAGGQPGLPLPPLPAGGSTTPRPIFVLTAQYLAENTALNPLFFVLG